MKSRLQLVFFALAIGFAYNYTPDYIEDARKCEPDCDSQVYCSGDLLHDVQTSKLFEDGTTFVDMQLLYPEDEIVEKYKKLKDQYEGIPPAEEFRKFIDQNFANDSLTTGNFVDFKENPSILSKTDNESYKDWMRALNHLWIELGGQVSEDVKANPDKHSYLYVPNRFVKAGGRFSETYYWDSFWIIKGLLLCDMHDTARGMIENIIFLVGKYGHMPNGNRIYYIKRSQPPMLIQMANEYYKITNDLDFIKENIRVLEQEFNWWMTQRQVQFEKNGKTYNMFRYKSISCTPRPESYAEDYELIKNMTSDIEKVKVLTGVISAAESGWDFSTRHMRASDNSNDGTLSEMDPMNMVYVDINSILHANARILGSWQKTLGNDSGEFYYHNIADNLATAINEVLWNDTIGIWLDYDLITNSHRNYFYASNLTPLWSKSVTNESQVIQALKYLISEGILDSDLNAKYYCVPASLFESPQQWDYPNCWAPLEAFIIGGLYRNRNINKDIETAAINLAQRWIDTTYAGYREQSAMFEKYDATKKGSSGGGGEYAPQKGFGWTNGLSLSLFDMWGNKLK